MIQTWDQTWMQVANTLALRSKCDNRQVGAVIVDQQNRPVSVGYNGPPAGYTTTGSCEVFCPRGKSKDRPASYGNCVSVHAEANALLFADRRFFDAATIYVTNPCCWECSKLISNSGITRIIMQVSEADKHATWQSSIDLFVNCGIDVHIIERENNAV